MLVPVDDDLTAGTASADSIAAAVSAASVSATPVSAAVSAAAVSVSGTLDAGLGWPEDGPSWRAADLLRPWRHSSEEPDAAEPSAASSDRAQSDSAESASGSAASVRLPVSRSAILQARRRMMTILVTLAIAALSCTAARLTPWWICVPPAGMLGMYLLLLREAARADAEMYQRRQEARRIHAARQRAREAWAARVPRVSQPTAQIIDISARVGDQLYDQYADATMRAVGD